MAWQEDEQVCSVGFQPTLAFRSTVPFTCVAGFTVGGVVDDE